MDRAELEGLMTRMAARDPGAFGEFRIAFDGPLVAAARWHARQIGWILDEGMAASLASQFALEICDHAGSWRSGGALPWTWMSRRFRRLVAAERHSDAGNIRFDQLCDVDRTRSCADDRDVVAVLRGLATEDRRVAGLLEWTGVASISDRDLAVWIEYRQQQLQGDPSPSATVADVTGLSPANVRQIAHRVTQRVKRVELAIAA